MVDQRFDHIDSGKLLSTGGPGVLAVPSVTWTQLPKTPPIAQSRTESASPVSSGTSERPWVRCSVSTPNTSAIVALRSTLVVSASTVVALSTPGQWIISGVWPSGSNCGTIGLPQMSLRPDSPGADRSFLAQVVAVVGAHDDGGASPTDRWPSSASRTCRTSGRSSRAWRRSWRGCGGPRASVNARS